MQATVLQEELATAVRSAIRFVPSRPQLPILTNFLLTAAEGKLWVSATDLQLGIRFATDAKIDQEGKTAVLAKEFVDFVNLLPAGSVELKVEKNRLLVENQKVRAHFAVASIEEFPKIPEFEGEGAKINKTAWQAVVERVAFAAATDDTRPVLTGVLLERVDKGIRLVATDSFRLALEEIKTNWGLEQEKLLVPARTLLEVFRLIDGEEIKVGLLPTKNQLIFAGERVQISSLLLEGEFPDYQRIIPKQFANKVVFEREELVEAIKLTAVFAKGGANVVHFSVAPEGKITLSASAPQLGENQVEVTGKVEGGGGKIAFNYRFLLDYLAVMPGEEVSLEFNDHLSPGLWRDSSLSSNQYLVMPVRIEE